MKALKIYIAGKVTGEPIHECTMKFGKAQKELEDLGHHPINPLEVVNNWKAEWQDAMKICIKALLDADAILLLPDYRQSKGALLEFDIARRLEIKRYYSTKGKIKSPLTPKGEQKKNIN